MSDAGPDRARLRRLVVLASVGVCVLAIAGAVLMLTGSARGAWPMLAGDVVLTLAVLALAWRNLR